LCLVGTTPTAAGFEGVEDVIGELGRGEGMQIVGWRVAKRTQIDPEATNRLHLHFSADLGLSLGATLTPQTSAAFEAKPPGVRRSVSAVAARPRARAARLLGWD